MGRALFYLSIVIFFFVSSWQSLVPLYGDELFSYAVAKQASSLSEILEKLRQGMDAHPPLHYWLIFAGIKLMDNPLGVRMPFIVIGAACGVLLYSICKKSGLSTKGSMVAANFLLVTSVQHYSIESRPYILLVLAQLLAIKYHLLTPMKYMAILAAFVIACYSHYLGILLVMNSILYTVVQRRLTVGYITMLIVTGLFCLPLAHIAFITKANYVAFSSEWARGSLWKHISSVYFDLLGQSPACLLLILSSYVFGLGRKANKPVNSSARLIMGFVAVTPIFGTILCYFVLSSAFHFRYTISGVVGIAFFFGVLFDQIPKSKHFIKVAIIMLIMVIMVKPYLDPNIQSPSSIIEHFNAVQKENSSLVVGDHITVMYLNDYFKNHPINVTYTEEWLTNPHPAFNIMKMFTLYFEPAVTLESIYRSVPKFIYFGTGFSKHMFSGFIAELDSSITYQPRELPIRDVTIFVIKVHRR